MLCAAAVLAALFLNACAPLATLPSSPAQAPLKERRLDEPTRARLQQAAAAGGADAAAAAYLLGLDEAAAGRWAQAGERWQSVVRQYAGSGWDRLAQFKTAQALEALGDGARAFVQYQGLLSGTAVADLPEQSRAACLRLIQSLPEEQLRQLAQGSWALEEFRAPIKLRVIGLDMDQGLTETARVSMEDYLKQHPNGPGLDQIAAYAKRLDAAVPVDALAIGLIVPTDPANRWTVYGQQVQHGVELAIAAANQGRGPDERFRLLVADEGQKPAQALEAGRRLIDQDHVIAILGPLNSDSAAALLPLVSSRRVVLFSPSAARPDLADASPWFFRNTLTPEKQAVAMADYAVVARRLTRVAALAPDNNYGQALADAFGKRVQELGGSVLHSVTYAPGTRDFRDEIIQLGGVDPGDAKSADSDEKRDQQSKVEEASTALGRYLLNAAKALSPPASAPGAAAALTVTPRLRLAVIDFSEDSACAEMNAGRSFADRFERTLGQLDPIEIVGAQRTRDWMQAQGLSPSGMTLPSINALGQALSVQYVLGGTCAAAGLAKAAPGGRRDRLFTLLAQLIDPLNGESPVQRRFAFTKFQSPPANPEGVQVLYFPGSAEDLGRLLPALPFYQLPLPLLGSELWERPELQRMMADLEGAVFPVAYWADSPDPRVRGFDEAFRQAYAARPDLLSAQAYDAASLLLERLRTGTKDRAALRNDLAKVSGWNGVSGRCSFEGRQDAVKRPALIRVHAGALQLMEDP